MSSNLTDYWVGQPSTANATFWTRSDITTDELVVDEVWKDFSYGGPNDFEHARLIVDVGANIGAFTVFAGLHSNARIVAIEPEPSNFEMLVMNVEENGLGDRVICRNHAVSSPNVTEVFMPVGEGGNSAATDTPYGKFTVPVTASTMDHILKGYPGEISFLKIDTEGHEEMIFEGLSDQNMKRIARFSLEYHGLTPTWGHMIRRLTKYHDLRVEAPSVDAHLYGGLCHGVRRI